MKFHIYRTSARHILDPTYKCKPCSSAFDGGARQWWYKDEEVSDIIKWRVLLSSLEDMKRLQEEVGCDLIVDFREGGRPEDCDGVIEIYDYPRE